MTTSIDASSLSLGEVESLFGFQQQLNDSINTLLNLEPLTEFEEQELNKIRSVFASYYRSENITEGQVKLLFMAPLLWLSGFYDPNINANDSQPPHPIFEFGFDFFYVIA